MSRSLWRGRDVAAVRRRHGGRPNSGDTAHPAMHHQHAPTLRAVPKQKRRPL